MTVDTLRQSIDLARLSRGYRRDNRTLVWLVGVALAAAAGAAAALSPVIAVVVAGGAALCIGLVVAGERSERGFLILLAGLLVGYAFLTRGFAYVGVRPVFVGELVLAVGIWAFLRALPRARFSLPSVFIILFMVWGAMRTIPYVGTYGIDALRDGVTWEYGAFALIVGSFATARHADAVANLYARLLPLFLVWVPIGTALALVGVTITIPGTPVSLIEIKAGDFGVQLAGIAAFMLAGLYATAVGTRVPEPVVWLLWFPAAAIMAAQNRGAMLAMAIAGLALILVRPSARWLRAFAVAFVLLVAAVAINPSIDTGDRRVLSVTQLLSNVTSVFGETGNVDLDGSRTWRLAWWDTIINYTVNGPYFWTGKGFGINLADADGFQVGDVGTDTSLRAPHNGHMEILARTGVPGFTLWVMLNAVWLITMLRALFRSRRTNDLHRAGFLVWLIVFWGAALVNASFDVYLQGPHGGIWFWSVVGLGIALSRDVPVRSDSRYRSTAGTNQTPAIATHP